MLFKHHTYKATVWYHFQFVLLAYSTISVYQFFAYILYAVDKPIIERHLG